MLLSDMGADVVRIDRPDGNPNGLSLPPPRFDVIGRGRRSIALDLKTNVDREICLQLLDRADAIIEGFRPGVMERLGLGPDVILQRNAKLVYGRMTGWGQTGPLAQRAGHDINYIAISGALHSIGLNDKPVPPLNLVGDFGGGALYLALGIVSALLHARSTGEGQVVDCSMSDGAASLMASFYGMLAGGQWIDERRRNLIDGGAHFYDTYQCKDGKWLAVGAIEAKFYAELLAETGLSDDAHVAHGDPLQWAGMRERLAALFASRTRAEWCERLEGRDACVAPVLSMAEAPLHPHNVARESFSTLEGVLQPAPAPRFSRTPSAIQGPTPQIGQHSDEVVLDWGVQAVAPVGSA
jgi:alpha-methylacyl-CoA racemase